MTEDFYAEPPAPPTQKKGPSAMATKNLRLLAERLRWPDGALDAVERIIREHHGWAAWWAPENRARGFECPAGFHAWREGRHRWERVKLFSDDPEDLLRAVAEEPPPRHDGY